MADFFIGIDIGGTNVNIGCFDSHINLIAKTSITTKSDMGPEDVVDRIATAAKTVLTDHGIKIEEVTALGIAAPGPANYSEGIICKTPNLPKFKNTPLRDMISKALTKPAILENDGNAACWGERVAGAGHSANEMVMFTLGTGIGGGVVSNGRLVRGYGENAAELGHMIIYPNERLCACGQKGCAEAYASADSTAKRATEAIEQAGRSSLEKVLKEKKQITCKDVFDHSATGDELAKEITDGTAKALALLCVNMLHTTGPERIVFAGGMIEAGNPLLDRIKHYFRQYIWPLKDEPLQICFAELAQDAGIFGAAALARDTFA